ncbi:PIN domain-like protein, partial [Hygrophoropsis aurantiaca]
MGVEKLWEVLAPAATTVSLPLLALQDRFQGGPPHTPYRIGVDVSILFERCQQVLMLRAHPQSGQNPALRTFFYRVTHLLRLPLQLVFCYDGDERPVRKREHNVSTKDHWMVKPTQRILDSLGIPWFRARGEAEAELAAMNAVGLIDAVMTDDSDVFVFGAQAVLRSSSLTANDTITLYTADGIQDKISPSLDCDGFILMALLCGGDYDTKGLVGCGSATALGLVRCGLAKAICFAMRTSSDRARSLTEWRHKLREHLLSDPTDDIGRRHPALASLVPDTFPDISVIDSYANPIILADAQRFHLGCPQPPNVANVAAIAQELFGWDDPTKLLKTFRKHVWPACVLQEVLQDLNSSSSSDEVELVPDATRVFFLHTKRSAKELNNAPGFNICIPTASLIGDTLSQLKRIEDFADGQESTSRGL